MQNRLLKFTFIAFMIFSLTFAFILIPIESLALEIDSNTYVNVDVTTDLHIDQQRFDVSNGFEHEVTFDTPTKLEWTLVKGDATYLFELTHPGKESGYLWAEFFTDLGWDTSQSNSLSITFTDGTNALLHADVL